MTGLAFMFTGSIKASGFRQWATKIARQIAGMIAGMVAGMIAGMVAGMVAGLRAIHLAQRGLLVN